MTKASPKPSAEGGPEKAVGRYRKVEVRMWGDEKFRELSSIPPCGQGLWLYLMTGPHTGPIPGLFRAGRAGMAEELGWELEDFDKAFTEVLQQGMVKADLKARVMWLPKAINRNRPESPNVVRGWASEFDLIPECDLKREAYDSLRTELALIGESFLAAFDQAIRKPSPKTSTKAMPNQEQEQDKQTGTGAGVVGAATSPPPAPPPPAAADAPVTTRGTRLSKDWVLPKAWGDWALEKYPYWTPDIVRQIASTFRNHWTEKTGKDATKITWKGTWENWCDSEITQRQFPPARAAATVAGALSESAAKAERVAGILGMAPRPPAPAQPAAAAAPTVGFAQSTVEEFGGG